MPGLVPIMVGATSTDKEKEYGRFLAPYLANTENLFIVSSDFCHWYRHALNRLIQGLSIFFYLLQQTESSFDAFNPTGNLL